MIHQIDSKNEWLLLSASFTGKFRLVFVLTLENRNILKPTEKTEVILKNSAIDFENTPLFESSACFYVTICENLNASNALTLEQNFGKMKSFFKNLEYCFLVESAKIKITLFPYKTAISKAYVKTNRMVTTKWTYQKEQSFASNYFISLKILFWFKNLL